MNHIDGKEIGTPALRKQLTAELNELFAGSSRRTPTVVARADGEENNGKGGGASAIP